MSAPEDKPLVFPLVGSQRAAVEPRDTVWLGASAGTGKTQVLSARVLRLLLQPGVRPEQILCLTFTKAGAAEMATRVNEVLASWVRKPATELAIELQNIGADIDPVTVDRARSRFAAVLDCPGGGLRIQTIHGFSQWLLGAFPLEAGMLPGTRALEDRDRDLLVRQVLADVLVEAEAEGDPALLEALAGLSVRLTSEQVEAWLLRCAGERAMWFETGAWQPPLRPRIDRLLGLGDDAGAGLLDLCGDGTFDCASLKTCAEAQAAWGTKTGLATADAIADWLAADGEGRLDRLDALWKALFTGDDSPRSLTAMLKLDPGYEDHVERVRTSIGRAFERRALIALADYMEPALALGRKFALKWDEAKQREGFIDFDDQIRHAADLLGRAEMADWVRFKLDRRFDHILVDEAQDTNAAQWDIVYALIDDFFSGAGQRGDDTLRTLFVVGDYKQAIFRFQGTSPENFERAKRRVAEQMEGIERQLQDLGLDRSFRTGQPLLDFVDAAIRQLGHQRFGLVEPPDPHRGEARPGLVALWPPIGGAVDEESDADAGDEGWLSRPDRQLAEKIAQQVRGWIDDGFPLLKGGARRAGPGDVMVLVRKRKELAGLIVARLHAHGVPVAGVDRLRLGAPLGVNDLVAALRFAAQPLDDLNLAALLVSPLIGWSQDELLEFAYRERGVRLWDHLRAAAAPGTLSAREQLLALLARADFETPQALLHWLLVGPWQGRRKLVARLGREVEDPIAELLNAAFAFAAGETASLVGFLNWFDANTSELKREAGRGEGLVRVMTVHGAKGLQAPIVILADAADDPDRSPPRGLALEEPVPGAAGREVPLPPLRKAEKAGAVLMAEERARLAERQEHWRLLYVAMTRAEEALFVAGTLGGHSRELPGESWYAALQPLFAGEPVADPIWGARHEFGALGDLPARAVAARPELAPLPEWALRPVGAEPRPPRPLAPSSSGEESAAEPPAGPSPELRAAAERGVLIHRLLERLPELEPEARGAAASGWLARCATHLPPGDRAEIAEAALAVLADPQWAEVFGPDSLAEVPIAATVGGRVVAGTIDRLVLGAETIRIVDFKTARRPPAELAEVPLPYIRQMAAYAAALAAIHPAMRVEAALLYTQAPRLIAISPELLAAHKPDSPAQQESFAG